LPSAQWAEEEGTTTNLEGRVIYRQRAMPPPPGVRTDLEMLSALAERLGHSAGFSSEPEAIFEELRRASAGGAADYAGISYERIRREDGVFWPCPNGQHPGTPRMFLERFGTADGRARFHTVEYQASAEEPDNEYPLYLSTGRILTQYQSGTQTRRVASLMQSAAEAFVQIHPSMATTYGVADGEQVRLTTRRGMVSVRAQLNAGLRMDTLFMPFHFPGNSRANLLTNPALDPVSRMPEFKVCAVRLEKENPC